MSNRKMKASVAVLALSGCATEGVPVSVAPDAGSPISEDASGPRRGPGARDDASDAGATIETDVRTNDLGSVGGVDARVSDLLAIVICTAMSLAGCDGGSGDLVPDGGLLDTQASTDVQHTDTIVVTDTRPGVDVLRSDTLVGDAGYTPNGVYANLGHNPCNPVERPADCPAGYACAWQPIGDDCFTAYLHTFPDNHLVCVRGRRCEIHQLPPGTTLISDLVNPRYAYKGDSSGGIICLLNDTTIPSFDAPAGCTP